MPATQPWKRAERMLALRFSGEELDSPSALSEREREQLEALGYSEP